MAGDLKVLIADPATGALKLGLSRPTQAVHGIDKLVQIVALALLNNGGRSIFNPSKGGGLRTLSGSNVDYDDPSELFADINLIVATIEQNIKDDQVTTTRPSSERLQQLQVVDIIPDENNLAVNVSIGVVNEDEIVSQAVVALT